jgi:hypothetical protein
MPEPSAFDVLMAIEKLKRYKLEGIDQIQQNRFKQEVGQYMQRSSLLILF